MHASTVRLITLAISAVAALAALTPSASAHDEHLSQYTKRELVARDRLFATLSEEVRRDLEARHPSEYELNLEGFMDRTEEEEAELVRREVASGPGAKHCLNGQTAMTYDDGPYSFERQLSAAWADAGHKISYMINVNNFNCAYNSPGPENLQYAMSRGHLIASHTGTHPHLPQLSTAQIDEQIQLVETYTYKTLGVIPAIFRPPYGETTKAINAHLKEKWGLRVAMWSVDSGDASGGQVDDQNSINQSVAAIKAAANQGGNIILNHETHETSVKSVAPRVIKYFGRHNKKSVSLAKCLGTKAYKVRLNTTPKRDASWNCNNVPAPGQS